MDKSSGNRELLDKAAGVLDQASVDVRRISHNMMPGNLTKFGLVAAIEDLFEEVNDSGVIKAEIKDDLAEFRISENKEIMLYRIVQELVNNTIKHAGASSISLNLIKYDHKILVRYADNGSGFNPDKIKAEKTMGIKSIEDRISFLGGELTIESAPGKGSTFEFDFPFS
jgi:signal transduction histidine kinase